MLLPWMKLATDTTMLALEAQAVIWTGRPRTAFPPGKFICPHDAAFDRDGSIYVTEWVDVGRVTKLEKVS